MPGLQEEAGASLISLSHPGSSVHPQRRRALVGLVGVVAIVILVLDQLSKLVALHQLTPGVPVDVLGTAIRLNLIRNAGAAFSLGDRATWLLTIIAVGVLITIASLARRLGSRAWAIAFGLILGGALGNLVDRFFRAPGPGRGHVVDFIDYFGLFIGNVADIAIVVAAAAIGLLSVCGVPTSGEARGRHTEQASTGES